MNCVVTELRYLVPVPVEEHVVLLPLLRLRHEAPLHSPHSTHATSEHTCIVQYSTARYSTI